MPVTNPVKEPTVATDVLLLLQVPEPPETVSESVVVSERQIVLTPLMTPALQATEIRARPFPLALE